MKACKAMDETQEKSSPLGPVALQTQWGNQAAHRACGSARQASCAASLMPMLAEGRETVPQKQPGPGQCCILSAGLLQFNPTMLM